MFSLVDILMTGEFKFVSNSLRRLMVESVTSINLVYLFCSTSLWFCWLKFLVYSKVVWIWSFRTIWNLLFDLSILPYCFKSHLYFILISGPCLVVRLGSSVLSNKFKFNFDDFNYLLLGIVVDVLIVLLGIQGYFYYL